MLLILLLVVCSASLPESSQAKSTTETYHFEGVNQKVEARNDCLGEITGWLDYKAVIHETSNENGMHWIASFHGTALVVPEDSEYPPFEGKFSETRVKQKTTNSVFYIKVVTQGDNNLSFHFIEFKLNFDDPDPTLKVKNIICGK